LPTAKRDTSAAVRPGQRTAWVAAVIVVVIAVGLRLPHLGWGLPDIEEEALPLKKAFTMGGWDGSALQLDPQTAGWPSLSFYVHLLLHHLVYWVGLVAGSFADRSDFNRLAGDFTPLVLAGRLLGVLAAGIVVLVAVRLGRRLSDSGGALLGGVLAGGLLAVSPLLFAESRLVSPDILLTCFAALAVSRLVAIHDQGRARDYIWAGVWIGLGTAAKYSPVLLAPALYLAHVLRLGVEARSPGQAVRQQWRRLGLDDRRLWWAAIACVGAFVVTSPFAILDLAVFKRDFAHQITHLSAGHFGHEARGWASFYYPREVLAPALGWPGFVIALAGLGWAAWRRRGAWLVVMASVLCLYLGLGSLSTQFDRYMLPLLLPLALGVSAAAAPLGGRLAGRSRALRLAATGLFAVVVLGPPAWGTYAVARSQALPGTLQLARAHILAELAAPDLVFAVEEYAPALPDHYPVLRIPMYSIRTELAAFYYDLRHYLPVDVIVTTSAVRGRYLAEPDLYPRQRAFYQDLERYAPVVFSARPDRFTRGPEIRIHRFRPAGRERLSRDRGPLAPGFYREFLPTLHGPHFHTFVGEIAWQAYRKDQFAHAALYYQTLEETWPDATARIFHSPHVMALIRIGEVDAARRRCEDALRDDPDNLEALVLLGLALEAAGEPSLAAAAYERCLARGQTGEPVQVVFFDALEWAQRLLAALRARLAE
jgi:tetratricopeptide (TPR) repeat protein